jgi:hypothetical protein
MKRQHARRTAPHSRRRAVFTVVAVLVVAAGGTAYAVRATEPVKNPADVVAHPCPATRPFLLNAPAAQRRGTKDTLVPDHPAVATFCRYDQLTRPDGWKLRDSAEVRGDDLATLVGALDAVPHGGSCPDVMHDNEMLGDLYFEYPSGSGVELLIRTLLPTADPCEHAENGSIAAYGTARVTLPLR